MTTKQNQDVHHSVTRCRMLIIGGGLAGLSAAIATTLASHEAIVLERMHVLREIGAGIQLPPNATKLLRAWGILPEVQKLALQPQKVNVRTFRHGEVLKTLDFGSPVEAEYGAPYLLIHRADLHRVLLQRARDLGVEFKLGANIEENGIDVAAGRIRLASGEEYGGDLILGADGERSLCRDIVLGHQDELHPTGDEIFRLTLKVSDLNATDSLQELVDNAPINYWMGPDSHVVSYVMSKGDMLNVILTTPEASEGNGAAAGVQKCDVAELRAKFRDWDPRFQKLLVLAQDCSKWSLMHSGVNERWAHPEGNLLLIGDSAHAMLPYLAQGAAQAFEDAAFLGTLLDRLPDMSAIPAVLDSFQSHRRSRTMEVRLRSKEMRDIFGVMDGPEQVRRDQDISSDELEGRSPIMLANAWFRDWLWGYDAIKEAEKTEYEDKS